MKLITRLLLLPILVSPLMAIEDAIDFNRDVRPIISDKCFHCHGPDADNQKSEFRLDTRENAIADLDGIFGIVPGNVEESDVHWRIWEDFEEDLMPPVDSNLSLTDEEKHTLDKWIEQGAPYDQHWAFKPIERAEKPDLSDGSEGWISNEIDWFVASRLEDEGLKPSTMAEKETLIRRVSLDLTGLPPSIEEVDAFLMDPGPNAWEKVVDRLLASSTYGERMALVWLDAARYADSGGYQNDIRRTQWPWRDWVIDAYNSNMPFDQFTIEQLAGDLLEEPTDEQLLATAFNRNHRINNEGGIIPEEFLVEYVADRAETTSTVWLGLTVACARCHDHKYDPISQKDFFQMYAFFNNVPENGKDGDVAPEPNMSVYNGATKEAHQEFKDILRSTEKEMEAFINGSDRLFPKWLETEKRLNADILNTLADVKSPSIHLTFDTVEKRKTADVRKKNKKARLSDRNKQYDFLEESDFGSALNIGISTYAILNDPHAKGFYSRDPRTWLVHVRSPKKFAGAEGPVFGFVQEGTQRGYRLVLEDTGDSDHYRISFQINDNPGDKNGIEVVSKAVVKKGDWSRLGVSWDGSGMASGVGLFLDGEKLEVALLQDNLAENYNVNGNILIGARSVKDAQGTIQDATLKGGMIDDLQIFDTALTSSEMLLLSQNDPKLSLLAYPSEEGDKTLQALWFKETPEARVLLATQKEQEKDLARFENKHVVKVSVMKEMDTPRDTFLLERGAYDHPDKSETLVPAVPHALPSMDSSYPQNRLGLARWLVDSKNPLTARVTVNRYWQMYFGTGLVKTPGDFGSQGALPSHPKLLDWLASEFMSSGWDVKALQKRIVMSSTYRQSSKVTEDLLEKDPDNRLLARGARFRLNGQALRDQALAVSGLIAEDVGGPPVMPYQPEGLWEEVNAKGYKYIEAKGGDLYRRSLYTFWRRTVPPPSMMNFDNSAREVCSVRLSSTNTPLQALNLMNDPQFVEAARVLGQRMILEGGETIADQIEFGHRTVLARSAKFETLKILQTSYSKYLGHFRAATDEAGDLITVGVSTYDETIKQPELAAMTMIASVLLNLDETVTKQ